MLPSTSEWKAADDVARPGTIALSGSEALALRMTSLLLRPHPNAAAPTTVADVVEWFGAMQAQDLASGAWSLGVRLPGSTHTDVHAALERREALRTWPMRGTIHLVPARDARWLLELTGVRALSGAAKRREFLGLAEAEADRAVDVLGAALAGGGRLTRAECVAALVAADIAAAGAELTTVLVDGVESVLHTPLLDAPRAVVDDVLTLPGFDEYLLGYKDRALMLDPEHKQAIIPGGNGVFQATVVVGGRVVGTWKRSLTRTRVTLTVQPLADLGPARREQVEQALHRYADFLALPPRVNWSD